MNAVLAKNNYGKSNVRVLKVKREEDIHEITEMTVNIQLYGDFETVHTQGDNKNVLPTDTMKNTVYAIAKEHPVNSIEEFGLHLAKYFFDNNSQVSKVKIDIEEKLWQRIPVQDVSSGTLIPHNHSFVSSGEEKKTAEINVTGNEASVNSGIKNLLVLKTTGSGFENYIKNIYTTLNETNDRVFSTSVKAVWTYSNQNINFALISYDIRKIILETFAIKHSLSVQQTLYEIGKNVIDGIEDVEEIFLSMPNKHYLLFNLEQFGLKNNNEIFIPTDEPFGLIEAVVKRN